MTSISDLVKFANKTYEKGFVSATDGNLSIRLSQTKIAITRSGINKGDVAENDIIIIDYLGNKIEGNGKPSSETKIHLLAYNERKDVNAVVHCHPVYSTAFATSNLDFTKPIFPEVIVSIGPVPLCKYATPSTEDLPNSMKSYIKDSWAMLLQNHGAVTFGEDIEGAYNRMEKLEHSAKTLFISRLLGGELVLSEEELNKLYSISESTYGIRVKSKYKLPSMKNSEEQFKYNSLTNSEINFSEIIDARLRARAGNPIFNSNFGNKVNRIQSKGNNSIDELKKLLDDFND